MAPHGLLKAVGDRRSSQVTPGCPQLLAMQTNTNWALMGGDCVHVIKITGREVWVRHVGPVESGVCKSRERSPPGLRHFRWRGDDRRRGGWSQQRRRAREGLTAGRGFGDRSEGSRETPGAAGQRPAVEVSPRPGADFCHHGASLESDSFPRKDGTRLQAHACLRPEQRSRPDPRTSALQS